jgi:hypothetical protein
METDGPRTSRLMDRVASRLELITGLLASFLGVGWFGSKLLFGISGVRGYSDPTAGPTSAERVTQPLQSFGALPGLVVILLLFAAVGLGVGSYAHSQRGGLEHLGVLWTCSALLIVGAAFLVYSLGIVLVAIAVLALVASTAAAWAIRPH